MKEKKKKPVRTKKELEELKEEIGEMSPDAMFADGLEDALLGIAHIFGKEAVVAYDYDKCIEIFMGQGMTWEEAEEWMSFNVLGAYVGETTPIYIRTFTAMDRDIASTHDPLADALEAAAAKQEAPDALSIEPGR